MSPACPKCLTLVCRCGHEWYFYEDWTDEELYKLQQHLTKILLGREADRLAAGETPCPTPLSAP